MSIFQDIKALGLWYFRQFRGLKGIVLSIENYLFYFIMLSFKR